MGVHREVTLPNKVCLHSFAEKEKWLLPFRVTVEVMICSENTRRASVQHCQQGINLNIYTWKSTWIYMHQEIDLSICTWKLSWIYALGNQPEYMYLEIYLNICTRKTTWIYAPGNQLEYMHHEIGLNICTMKSTWISEFVQKETNLCCVLKTWK